MTIEADIYKRLKNYTGLSNLVSTRIYADVAPQDATRPYLVWQTISTPREQAISGTVAAALSGIQFTAWDEDWDDVRSVIVQLRAAILAMTGDTVTLYGRTLENERSGYEDETRLHWRSLDVSILHSE